MTIREQLKGMSRTRVSISRIYKLHDNNSSLRRSLHVDVINAGSGATDNLQPSSSLDDVSGHFGGRPHDQTVVFLQSNEPADRALYL
jgi:hypothetical protein